DITSTGSFAILAWTGGAGTIDVTSAGDIQAYGPAIFAWARDGDLTIDSTGNVTSDSNAGIRAESSGSGDITVTSAGNLQAKTSGIYARAEGAITIESTGDVISGRDGIFAAYGATIDVKLLGGTVHGVQDGVEFADGGTNTLTNYAALSGGALAVRGSSGDETVHNHGTISGNINLGTGLNSFFNETGGVFRAGQSVDLGAGNTLTNRGALSPGGAGSIETTVITGNLVQTAAGIFVVDIDDAGQGADRVSVTGTADFAGFVRTNFMSIENDAGSVLIADADALTSTATVEKIRGLEFSLDVLGEGRELWLNWRISQILELISGPMTPNQEATAIYLTALQSAGPDAALRALLGALRGLPNEAELLAAIDRLHGEHYLSQVHGTVHSNLLFLSSAMSCPTVDGGIGPVTEGECYWAKVGARRSDWDRTWTNIGGREDVASVSGGLQVAISEHWRLGFAASYESTDASTNNAASSEGERVQGAALLKTHWGQTTFAGAAFGGHGWFDTTRRIGLAGIATAEGDHEIAFGGVHARFAHVLSSGSSWYLRPMIDLNATYLDFGGFTETAGGAAALSVSDNSDWVLSASPAIEIGAEWRRADGLLVRPFARVGVTFFDDATFALTSSFVGAPESVAPFTVRSEFDQTYLDIGAGLDVLGLGGIDIKLNYDGRFSDKSESHAAGIKAGVRF
ncbi:autotransporter outer membrane beta-barrel domain-containing protein, partial [Hyphomicrobium sp.]|uniref:autotransporter outer membrane beta-barrel domain-containing protein n=1 Tax=Hyphomicrobium sp. TaxID=82 RepID=UPI002D772490